MLRRAVGVSFARTGTPSRTSPLVSVTRSTGRGQNDEMPCATINARSPRIITTHTAIAVAIIHCGSTPSWRGLVVVGGVGADETLTAARSACGTADARSPLWC
jgi:hypothetical protein